MKRITGRKIATVIVAFALILTVFNINGPVSLAGVTPVKDKPLTYRKGHGSIVISVKNENKAMANVIFTDADAAIEAVLSEAQLDNVNHGSKVQIKVFTEYLPETKISVDDNNIIDGEIESLKESLPYLKKAACMDIKLMEKIDHENWKVVPETLAPIRMVIHIPEPFKGLSQNYYALCLNDDEVILLEDLDNNADTITVETDRFSIYTIVYDEGPPVTRVVRGQNSWKYYIIDGLGWFTAAGILIVALIRSRFKKFAKR